VPNHPNISKLNQTKGNKKTLIKSNLCALCVKPLRPLRLKNVGINRKARKENPISS
jgi:hypothetical protein